MKRLLPSVPVPIPSVEQVLWRSGCPAGKAGSAMRGKAEKALGILSGVLPSPWCGAVLYQPGEIPETFSDLWPGLPVTVMAATLGPQISAAVEKAGELEGFLLDAAASVAVESYMKRLQGRIAELLGMEPTRRAAPGYGEMPLSVQAGIIAMFPDSGISCGESFMLSPAKSMTGVTGWVTRQG